MPTIDFVDGVTVIPATWLNEVDEAVFNPASVSIPASSVVNTPAGNIAATDIQAAINELDSEKQPLDDTLTALAGWTNGIDKIPYTSATDTVGSLTWNSASALANDATTVSSNTVIKTAIDAMDIATQVTPSTSGNVLTSNGSAWVSQAPTTTFPTAYTSSAKNTVVGETRSWAGATGFVGALLQISFRAPVAGNLTASTNVSESSGVGTATFTLYVDGVSVYSIARASSSATADTVISVSAGSLVTMQVSHSIAGVTSSGSLTLWSGQTTNFAPLVGW